jgi:hypothetical protein
VTNPEQAPAVPVPPEHPLTDEQVESMDDMGELS